MPLAGPAHAIHGREPGRADLGVLVAVLCKGCSLRDWVDVPVIATVCRQAQAQSADATRWVWPRQLLHPAPATQSKLDSTVISIRSVMGRSNTSTWPYFDKHTPQGSSKL